MQVAEKHQSDWNEASPPARAKQWARLGMPLLILVVTILFNWKLALTRQFVWLEHPDGINQVLPWLQFQAIQWHQWHFPAWDPNAWTGQPLFGQTQPGSAYPFNWLFFLAPLKEGFININLTNLYLVFIRLVATLAGYALCRDLRCSRIASLAGAFVVGAGGFVGNNGWPQMLNGAIWAPLVFLFLFRAARGESALRNAILSGFFLGFSWLSGHHQVPTYLMFTAAAIWIWLCLRDGRWNWHFAKLATISFVIAIAASAFQSFPTTEYGRLSVRWVSSPDPLGLNDTVPYYLHEKLADPPLSLLSVFLPNVNASWNPFIGSAAFTLAILGLILAWRQPHVRTLGAIAACSLLFTIGPNSIIHGVLYAVMPLLDKTRSAGAATAIFGASIAPLCAIGVDRIWNEPWWAKRTAWIVTILGSAIVLTSAIFGMLEVKGPIADPRLLITGLCLLAIAVLFMARASETISTQSASVAVFLVILFELANVTNYWLPHRGYNNEGIPLTNNLAKHHDLAHFLSERPDHGRIEYRPEDIPYNFGDYFNLETFQSYTASVTKNIWDHDIFSRRGRNFLGVRYSISANATEPEQKMIFESQSGLKVFENPGALPRVWSVHQSVQVADQAAARKMLDDPAFDPLKTAILVGASGPKLDPCAAQESEHAEISLRAANRMWITANLSCPGMVILDDTWFPGWRAKVDGKPAEIFEAYGMYRGVLVPAGQHSVAMVYRPVSIIAGGILSLMAAIVAALTWTGVLFPSRKVDPRHSGTNSL